MYSNIKDMIFQQVRMSEWRLNQGLRKPQIVCLPLKQRCPYNRCNKYKDYVNIFPGPKFGDVHWIEVSQMRGSTVLDLSFFSSMLQFQPNLCVTCHHFSFLMSMYVLLQGHHKNYLTLTGPHYRVNNSLGFGWVVLPHPLLIQYLTWVMTADYHK